MNRHHLRLLGTRPSAGGVAWVAQDLDAAGGVDSGDTSYLGTATATSIDVGGADATGSDTYAQTSNVAEWGYRTWPLTLPAGTGRVRLSAVLERLGDNADSGIVIGVGFANHADLASATTYDITYFWWEDPGSSRIWYYRLNDRASYGGNADATPSDQQKLQVELSLEDGRTAVQSVNVWLYKADGAIDKEYAIESVTGDYSGGAHLVLMTGVRRASGSTPGETVDAALSYLVVPNEI